MPDDQMHSLPPTQSASLEAGQRVFRHYVLHRFLGRGALGAAWLVVHEGHGRELAMRFVPEAWLRDERAMSALRDAVVKLLDITHPALVGVLDFVRDPQAAAIVTRFVDGKTLHDLRANAEERFLPLSMLQSWLAQLCDALDFAWRRHGATHGDLCPQNLLVTEAEEFRILDFGLARSLYDLPGPTGTPLITGTQAYVSPERARGLSVTVADDVYGFGATVYELLTSRPVFFRGNLLWQLESVVPPSMTERRAEFGLAGELIPPEWEQVIAACLAKRREDRPKDLREVGERLGLLNPTTEEDSPTPMVLPRSPDLNDLPSGVFSLQSERPVPEFSSSLQTVSFDSMTQSQAAPDLEVTREAAPPPPLPSSPPTQFVPPDPPVSVTASTASPPADDESDQTVAATEPPPPKVPPMAEIKTVPPPLPPPPEIPKAASLPTPPPSSPPTPPPLPVPVAERKVEAPFQPATQPPSRPEPKTSTGKPVANPLKWIIPAGVGAAVLVGGVVFILSQKSKTPSLSKDQPTPDITPVPSTPLPPKATPVPVAVTPVPITPKPADIKGATVAELAPLANRGRITEKLFLVGEFRVSTSLDRIVTARPTAKELTSLVRVTARFPQAVRLPAEGSTVKWSEATGLLVREVRKGNDGQLNIEVEKER
jgi:serine/threonine protein kinase